MKNRPILILREDWSRRWWRKRPSPYLTFTVLQKPFVGEENTSFSCLVFNRQGVVFKRHDPDANDKDYFKLLNDDTPYGSVCMWLNSQNKAYIGSKLLVYTDNYDSFRKTLAMVNKALNNNTFSEDEYILRKGASNEEA